MTLPHEIDPFERALEATAWELPRRVLATYARLWQLETWLRQMVYVELRANFWKRLAATSRNFICQLPKCRQSFDSHANTGAASC